MNAPAPVRHLAAAFRFLTRLPFPGGALERAELGRALAWFPLPGLVLGAAAAGAVWLARAHLAATVTAALVVAMLAWLTGGLHLDGLADVADGLGGGHGDPARALTIMRDSRIGAFGAIAVASLLVVKVAAVGEVVSLGTLWPLLCAPAVARFAAVPLVVLFPYARPEGLGKPFHEGGGARELVVSGVVAAAVVAVAGLRAVVPAAAALVAALVLALVARRKLGGLTGDVYGAAIEVAETVFLVVAGGRVG